MSLPVLTTQEISDQIVAQLEGQLSQTIPLLPKAFLRVLAKVLAGVFILVYKYAGFVFLQLFVAYASTRATTINGKTVTPLVEWGRLVGVGDPVEAERAELVVDIPVLNQTGELPGFTRMIRADTGIIYHTISPVALDAPTVQATVRAISDQQGGNGAGAAGNLPAGAELSIASAPPQVSSTATVNSTVTQGADGEDLETTYRKRVIQRFQRRPQGGAYADYHAWAVEVAGIINAYPYTSDNPGEVDVYIEADEASSGSADGIPTDAQVDAVEANIDLDLEGKATRRPANAAINVLKITRTAFNVDISGLSVNDEVAVKAQIEDGVDEYFRDKEPYIVGLSTLPRRDRITRAGVSAVIESIVSAAGGIVPSITLKEGAVGITARTLLHGEKAKLEAGGPNYV